MVLKKLIFTVLVTLNLLILLTSCSTPSLEDEQVIYPQKMASAMEVEILDLVNEYRLSKGLNTLEFDHVAYDYASSHTKDMISEGQISHDDFDIRSSNLAQEANADYVSENVGKSFSTAKGIVEAWIKSPTHRKVMEGNFLYTAVSAKPDDSGMFYFTQLFYR